MAKELAHAEQAMGLYLMQALQLEEALINRGLTSPREETASISVHPQTSTTHFARLATIVKGEDSRTLFSCGPTSLMSDCFSPLFIGEGTSSAR